MPQTAGFDISCFVLKEEQDMKTEEKIYKTMNASGIISLTAGIIIIVTGVVAGVMAIISGSLLLGRKKEVLF